MMGILNALGLGLGALLIVCPIALFPVGVVSIALRDSLLREYLWHMKFLSGFSVLDILIILFAGLTYLVFFFNAKKKIFAYIYSVFILVFLIGFVSAVNAPFGVDYKLLLNAFRTILIVSAATILAYRLNHMGGGWETGYIKLLLLLTSFSMLSMALLDSDFRGERYWAHAILQSQAGTLIAAIALVLLLFSREFSREPMLIKAAILIIPFIIAVGGGVKGMMSSIAICFLLFLVKSISFTRRLGCLILRSRIISVLIICFFYSGILIFNTFMLNISSIDTRYFQVANSLYTIQKGGLDTFLFGIGWKQWYSEFISFPFLDYGAWTDEEIALPGQKNSVQLLPFSFVRSVGLVGFFIFFGLMMFVYGRYSFRRESNESVIRDFAICFFLISEMFAIPDILPEAAFFSSLILFSGVAYKKERKSIDKFVLLNKI